MENKVWMLVVSLDNGINYYQNKCSIKIMHYLVNQALIILINLPQNHT